MSVSTLVLLGLAVVWAIVLLPEVAKKLSGVRSGDSIHSFRSQLSSLERSIPGRRRDNVIDLRDRTQGAPVRSGAPRPVSPALRRRRQEVIGSLAGAAVLTLLCAVAFGGAFLLLHLLADALLVAYLVLLNQANLARAVRPAVAPLHGTASRRNAGGLTADHGLGAVGRVTPVATRRIAN
jgi:hypothetical protein